MNKKLSISLNLVLLSSMSIAQNEKPNFVWIMTEDVSSDYINLYNSNGVDMPNVEALAKNGIIYNNAYSNAPVSSAARSTLFTGYYANKTGIGYHRKIKQVDLGKERNLFVKYLKEQGYYTTNSKKTDYNFINKSGGWDEISASNDAWRNREKGQPFFHVVSYAYSHEGSLHFDPSKKENQKTDFPQENVVVAPIHPNTDLMRLTYARFYDRISYTDSLVGNVVNELKKDSLLDNTFIFFFGDNGGVLPGTKGYSSELGLKVPLVVYVPEKWRDKLEITKGERVNGFVSFVDFAPTLLTLSGIEIPETLDGESFLGEDVSQTDIETRDEVLCYGDRFDEYYNFFRTYRKGDFKYIRNFQGYQPKSLHTFYRYKMKAFLQWKEMHEEGELNSVQNQFFESLGAEELYLIKDDFYQTENLANNPKYKKQLKKMRNELNSKMVELLDIGIYPECEWIEKLQQGESVTVFTERNKENIKKYIEVANYALFDFDKVKSKLIKSLLSNDVIERYWAINAAIEHGESAKEIKQYIEPLLNDKVGYVSSRAAIFCKIAQSNTSYSDVMQKALNKAKNDAERLMILGDIVYMNDEMKCDIKPTLPENIHYNNDVKERINYILR